MFHAQNVLGFCPCSVLFLKLYPDRVMNIVQEKMSSFSVDKICNIWDSALEVLFGEDNTHEF